MCESAPDLRAQFRSTARFLLAIAGCQEDERVMYVRSLRILRSVRMETAFTSITSRHTTFPWITKSRYRQIRRYAAIAVREIKRFKERATMWTCRQGRAMCDSIA